MKSLLVLTGIVLTGVFTSKTIYKYQLRALTVPELITIAAETHKVEREHLSCILKIESEYRLNVVSNTRDHGIGQINERTAAGFKMDLNKLTTDLEYSIDKSAYMLSYYQWLKRHEEPRQWVCRYNVGPGPLTKASRGAKCEEYLERFNGCLAKGEYL